MHLLPILLALADAGALVADSESLEDSFPDLAMEFSSDAAFASGPFSALLMALASSPFADLVLYTFNAEYSKMKVVVSETQIIME